MSARRLPTDVAVDRVTFSFDGVAIDALATDTVASALVAANVERFGSDPHTGDPYRGFCFVGRCAECLVQVDGVPGVMACRTAVRAGMQVTSQESRGSWTNGASA